MHIDMHKRHNPQRFCSARCAAIPLQNVREPSDRHRLSAYHRPFIWLGYVQRTSLLFNEGGTHAGQKSCCTPIVDSRNRYHRWRSRVTEPCRCRIAGIAANDMHAAAGSTLGRQYQIRERADRAGEYSARAAVWQLHRHAPSTAAGRSPSVYCLVVLSYSSTRANDRRLRTSPSTSVCRSIRWTAAKPVLQLIPP